MFYMLRPDLVDDSSQLHYDSLIPATWDPITFLHASLLEPPCLLDSFLFG